jgi:hypothetical protein
MVFPEVTKRQDTSLEGHTLSAGSLPFYGEDFMEDITPDGFKGTDRRTESRSFADKYSSVEFSIKELPYNYQFKIWETSPSGVSILIKKESAVLGHLRVGDILTMKYYPIDNFEQPESFETEIKHISKNEDPRFKGLYLIGLSLSEKQS